jgi:CSLREA domain-containing protein/uncharacterized repeat protein (TIGR01451 family)
MQGFGAMLMRRVLMLLAVTVFAVLGMAGVASAANTFNVNTTADTVDDGGCTTNPVCSLRDAVIAADNAGGQSTINLLAKDYTLMIPPSCVDTSSPGCDSNDPAQGDLDIQDGANVTIDGAGSGSTTIDAAGIDRAFAVQPDTDGGPGALTLSGMTIEQGSPSSLSSGNQAGGAIWSDGALTLSNDVTLKGNSAPIQSCEGRCGGGAIFAGGDSGSTLTVNGATFSGNNAASDGGAIEDLAPGTGSAAATITNSTFDNNLNPPPSGSGGAIFGGSGAGDMTVDSSSFTGNTSSEGGAIAWEASSAVTVTQSTFTGNAASGNDGGSPPTPLTNSGGAILDDSSTSMTFDTDQFTGNSAQNGGALALRSSSGVYTLDHSELDRNSATDQGGAVDLECCANLSSEGSSFIHNSGGAMGGAIFDESDGGELSLVNATISENSASRGGGVSFFESSVSLTLTNDSIAYNTASSGQGGGISGTDDATTDSKTTGVENTIIGSNTGGDCSGEFSVSTQFPSSVDAGNNMDSDGSCFRDPETGNPLATGDQPGVNPMLGHPADNGGPVLTDSDLGSPAIDAGDNTGCPSTDARGAPRPQGAACDMGAYEASPANLSVSKSAPSSAGAGAPFEYTVTVSNSGPASSTGTTLVDGIPAGETLWSVNSSQGSCSVAGGQVTCNLGRIDTGAHATVTMVVSEANAGSVTNTATAANDEGSSVSGSATTSVTAPPSTTTTNTITVLPPKVTGSLLLVSNVLKVANGNVSVLFKCKSNLPCFGTFTIEKRVRIGRTHQFGPLVCTQSRTTHYNIPAGATKTVKAGLSKACLALLKNSREQSIKGKLSSGPRSGQAGVIKSVTMRNA